MAAVALLAPHHDPAEGGGIDEGSSGKLLCSQGRKGGECTGEAAGSAVPAWTRDSRGPATEEREGGRGGGLHAPHGAPLREVHRLDDLGGLVHKRDGAGDVVDDLHVADLRRQEGGGGGGGEGIRGAPAEDDGKQAGAPTEAAEVRGLGRALSEGGGGVHCRPAPTASACSPGACRRRAEQT